MSKRKINDIDLKNWRDYDDIITTSFWDIEGRQKGGQRKADFHGNFVPQIPYQMMIRYTKEGDWVLDPFLGYGTTALESKSLNRNIVGIDINKTYLEVAQERYHYHDTDNKPLYYFFHGNSSEIEPELFLKEIGIEYFDFIILHPPYFDIIKFSEESEDLSNSSDLQDFLNKVSKIAELSYTMLRKDSFCTLVMGDKYEKGQYIPLGFLTMDIFMKKGFSLKSILVKNFGLTSSKRGKDNLWRYRSLAGGFYTFDHEYIFIFNK